MSKSPKLLLLLKVETAARPGQTTLSTTASIDPAQDAQSMFRKRRTRMEHGGAKNVCHNHVCGCHIRILQMLAYLPRADSPEIGSRCRVQGSAWGECFEGLQAEVYRDAVRKL